MGLRTQPFSLLSHPAGQQLGIFIMSDPISTATQVCGHRTRTAHEAVLRQAEGILMDWYDIPSVTAQRQLNSWAVECDSCACQLAEAFVHGICLGKATSCPKVLLRRLEQLLRQLPAPTSVQ
jgi:hypothetical protein